MIACYHGHKDVVILLLDHSQGNIDFNAENYNGSTGFMMACSKGHKDVVKVLLDHSQGNIDFNAKYGNGRTGFMMACYSGYKDVVKLILKYAKAKGIEIPNSLWEPGSYLLQWAKEIKFLLDEYHGTAIAEEDNSIWTKWIQRVTTFFRT